MKARVEELHATTQQAGGRLRFEPLIFRVSPTS
jgi:hypothetical protein